MINTELNIPLVNRVDYLRKVVIDLLLVFAKTIQAGNDSIVFVTAHFVPSFFVLFKVKIPVLLFGRVMVEHTLHGFAPSLAFVVTGQNTGIYREGQR